jgi:hypothetical protein
LNSGNVPSAAQASFRGAVGTNTSNTFDAARRATGARHVGPPTSGRYATKQEVEKKLKEAREVSDDDSVESAEEPTREDILAIQRRQRERGRGGASATTEEAGAAAAATEAPTYEDIKNAVENNRDLSKFISSKASGLEDTSKLINAAEVAISRNDSSTYEAIESSLVKRYDLGAAPYVDNKELKKNVSKDKKQNLATRLGKTDARSLSKEELLQIASQEDIKNSLNDDYEHRIKSLKRAVEQSDRGSISSRPGPGRTRIY